MASVQSEGVLKGKHEWIIKPQQFTWGWSKSEEFFIKNLVNCDFSVWLRVVKCRSHDTVCDAQISVRKSNKEEIKADVSIRMFCGPLYVVKTKIMENWTESCDFTGFLIYAPFNGSVHPNGPNVTLKCNILWHGPTNMTQAPPPLNIQDDFQRFLLEASLSDVKIIIGEEELPAHKLILGAHSPVFLSMFETDMKEAKENKIVIKDSTPDILKIVLSILYTGSDKSLNNYETALNVLFVAEKYDMKKLKDLCEYTLYKQLTISNALEILDSAEDHNAEKLKENCLKFINENKTDIVYTPDFQTLCMKKPQLMFAFMKNALGN